MHIHLMYDNEQVSHLAFTDFEREFLALTGIEFNEQVKSPIHTLEIVTFFLFSFSLAGTMR